jgi:outer membrane protein, heavy metal efflux system
VSSFIVSLALLAAPPLRLSTLLEDARQRSPELQAAQAQARAAASAVSPAGALDDPLLTVEYWNGPVDFSVVPIMVQLTQTFPLGGKLRAKEDAAAADARAARGEALTRLRDLEREVTDLYVRLFVIERTLGVHDEVLGVLRSLQAVASARVASGRTEVVDQLKAQAELLKEEAAHQSLVAERTVALARLAALLDRDPGELGGTAEEPASPTPPPTDEELLTRALRERPELQVAASTVQAAEARTRLASAASVPDITPLVAYMHTFNQASPNNFLFLGLQANLPIFGGNKIEPAVSAARARVEAAEALQRALRNRIATEVRSAAAQLRAEQELVRIQRRLVPISRQALDSAVSAYSAGRIGLLTVLDSEREALMREVELAQHLSLAELRRADLERAVGGPLQTAGESR